MSQQIPQQSAQSQGYQGQQVPGDWSQQQLQMQQMQMMQMHQMQLQQGGGMQSYVGQGMSGTQSPGGGNSYGGVGGQGGDAGQGNGSQAVGHQAVPGGYMAMHGGGGMVAQSSEGGSQMAGMASPYPIDGQGGSPQAMMMMQGGVPGGFVMMPQGMQGMQGMQGLPPNVQLMMVQPGMAGMQGMQGMQGMPGHAAIGHPGGQGQDSPGMMMMAAPAGAVPGGQSAGGMNQVAMMNQSALDSDGKASRVAALSRSSQPKQGTGGWHASDRRGGGRPTGSGTVGGLQRFDDGANSAHLGSMSAGPGAEGGVSPSDNTGGSSSKTSRMNNPKNPWADIQDAPFGALDAQTREMWHIQPGQVSHVNDMPPHRGQGHIQGGQQQSRGGKARGEGKAGNDFKKGGGGRASAQDSQPAQKWVEVLPADHGASSKGKNSKQDRWAPKEPTPKASAPTASLAAIPAAPLIPPAGKGGGFAGAGMGGGGGKKKQARDQGMDDWLSQRFAGQPPPTSEEMSGGNGWDFSDDKGKDAYPDYGGEEGGGRRGSKKREARGSKGKGDDRRREKGKGKGKGRGSFWRSTSG
mmetsp:Transcript_9920/g.22130  ORF Transcript_9920/g.22130 Transcript_9920/m.22130 type:complete len:576 (+) Transcript_9920:148-1875(+)